MDKKFVRLILFIPILVLLMITNIYQDPANLFHDDSKPIAHAILSGHSVYSTMGNEMERAVKYNLILKMSDEIDCVAIGSSLVMCVNQGIVREKTFYNLGVSGADYNDILSQLGLLAYYGKKPKRIILCVDFRFFDEDLYGNDSANLYPYAEFMIEKMKGQQTKIEKKKDKTNFIRNLEQIFSISYFQASVAQIQKNKSFKAAGNRWGIVGENFDGSKNYYNSDASLTYDKEHQQNGVDYVKYHSKYYDIVKEFSYNKHLDDKDKKKFNDLISYLLHDGINVELFLCPATPDIWDRLELDNEHYNYGKEIEKYVREIAWKYQLKITGSYNPYKIGIKNEDFYDARHVRRESLPLFFDFTNIRS